MSAPGRALTTRQAAALDMLLDLIEQYGHPGPDGEPEAPLEIWRTSLRTLYVNHTNVRRTVRTVIADLIASGVVIERGSMVAVGTYYVDIAVVTEALPDLFGVRR
jgi:hypothetical protein